MIMSLVAYNLRSNDRRGAVVVVVHMKDWFVPIRLHRPNSTNPADKCQTELPKRRSRDASLGLTGFRTAHRAIRYASFSRGTGCTVGK